MRLSLPMELAPASPIRGCGVAPTPLVRGSEYPRTSDVAERATRRALPSPVT
jgi:hypothetical protein